MTLRRLEASSVLEERENIRLLHQRNQEPLTHISFLEKKFNNVSIDDSEILRRSNSQLGMPGTNFLVHQPLNDKEHGLSNKTEGNSSFDKADYYSSDDSDDTVGSGGMDNDDGLTNDDLVKYANHVQKLLQQIESLQSLVLDITKTSHHSKHHILKAYCPFC